MYRETELDVDKSQKNVFITKKYVLMFPYTCLIFHLGQLLNPRPSEYMPFFNNKKVGFPIPNIWQKILHTGDKASLDR